jgi:1-acyl-sn-glycerol-3-phosphate acyltransferase
MSDRIFVLQHEHNERLRDDQRHYGSVFSMTASPFVKSKQDLRKADVGYYVITAILTPLLRRFGKLEVLGKENIPHEGAILVSNHVGWLDPLWLGVAAWPRPVYPMAKSELFKNRIFGWVIGQMGAFPVNRNAPGPSALKLPLQIAQKGGLVAVFPGGRRSADLTEIKRGAATIAVLANCPVVVARYQGPSKLRVKDLLRRAQVVVSFAAALHPAAVGKTPSSRKQAIAVMSEDIKSSLEGQLTFPLASTHVYSDPNRHETT